MKIWWNPILKSPIEHGIIDACKMNVTTQKNINELKEMMEEIFLQYDSRSIENPYISQCIKRHK